MNAHEPLMVPAIINDSGVISVATASPARVGSIREKVAVLLVISVRKAISRQTARMPVVGKTTGDNCINKADHRCSLTKSAGDPSLRSAESSASDSGWSVGN